MKDLSELLLEIGRFLESQKVNFTFNPTLCELICQVYFMSYELAFRVFIYKDPDLEFGFIVEFQRNSVSVLFCLSILLFFLTFLDSFFTKGPRESPKLNVFPFNRCETV